MTETTPPPESPPETPPVPEPVAPEVPPVPEPEPARREPLPVHSSRPARVLTIVGFLLLVGVDFYLWQQQQTLVPQPGADPERVAAQEMQIRALQQRIAQLEQRPAPTNAAPTDLRPLEARIAALEQHPAAAPEPDIGPLLGRVNALEQHAGQADAAAAAAAKRADRAIRLQAAAAALDAGQPLGAIPDAPVALARFATEKPPTEADLRLSFPDAASRAAEASNPATDGKSMTERMWQRIASLVTVRSGDRVIVGAPASVVLDQARARLDAGDLAGAVTALDGLDPGAAKAMADWRARAQSLLDARAALASLARS
jgi:hypothetical protein